MSPRSLWSTFYENPCIYAVLSCVGLSSTAEGTALAMESSQPLMEAFQEEEEEGEESDEDELEEDMVS